jgi:hypothetical protein
MGWQTSEPAFYEAIDLSDGCTDGFASRVGEFANSIPPFLRHGEPITPATAELLRTNEVLTKIPGYNRLRYSHISLGTGVSTHSLRIGRVESSFEGLHMGFRCCAIPA